MDNIEELRSQLVELQESIKSIREENESLKASAEEKDKRINSLTEYNNKLFQKVTSPIETSQEKEKTSDDYANDIVNNLLKEKHRF